jgi:hypothetical protein
MMKCLSLPKGAKEELNYPSEVAEKIANGLPLWEEPVVNENEDEEDGEQEAPASKEKKELTADQKHLITMFGEGKYHMIPSFFRMLIYLKKQKREFSVVFRTFGEDLEKCIWEFNQFCEGKHPCFSGRNGTPMIKFDGTKGTKDLRLKDDNQRGLFYRFSSDFEDTKFLQGTSKRETNDFDKLQSLMMTEAYEDLSLRDDPISAYLEILAVLQKNTTMAVQDDYQNWKENDFHCEAGKPLYIDQADYGTHHIFFDDNADEGEDCIVDVRDVITKQILTYDQFINKYVVRVEPHRAIMEVDYFIKQIEFAEQNRDQEIERVEAG